ncbi:MAG: CoA transferase [Vicinamibacteria bacterium]|nr:CoA transferase [Vicinamibacteria bacterium]
MADFGPLSGFRVLELAHIMAGPVCGRLLATLGADVIKIEGPEGDPARNYRPPELAGESAAFMALNVGKRSLSLDLKHPAGRDVLLRLVENADVLIENFRTGTMARLGLGYERLSEINPRLIVCEISGFGRTGPLAERGGFDLIAQGLSGVMSLTGEEGAAPMKCGVPVTDITAAVLAAVGVLAASHERQTSARGQRVDTSLFEAGLFQTLWASGMSLATGEAPAAQGTAHPLTAPYQTFATADGWINLGAASQTTWRRVPEVVELPELLTDPRFTVNAGRMAHREELVALLRAKLRTRPTAHWIKAFDSAGVPAGPVLDVVQAHQHPQALARDMVVETSHAAAGTVLTLGVPIKFSRTPGAVGRAAPLLGQHTREVLAESGFNAGDIDRLLSERAILQA